MSKETKKVDDKLTDNQVVSIYDHIDKMDTHSNKELLELDGEPENKDIPDEEVLDESSINPGLNINELTEQQMREMGLDEDTINDLKDVEISPEDIDVAPSETDYLEAISAYADISTDDAAILLEVITEFNSDPKGKYYDKLPKKVQQFCDGIRINSPTKMSRDSSARFVLTQFVQDAQFGKLMDDYSADMANLMTEMHGEFQAIVQESFDDLFSKIDEIKDKNPEHAEVLERFYDAFKGATTFQRQLDYLDGGLSKKKLDKWVDRFDNHCFYFNKKVNSDSNKEKGIKFADIRTLIPIVRKALNGFTEIQVKQFFTVFMKSVEKMDMNELENLFYIYGVVSAIDSFRYNTAYEDTDLGKTLFGNITKVIQKINSLK